MFCPWTKYKYSASVDRSGASSIEFCLSLMERCEMQRRWIARHVDLEALSKSIAEFLTGYGCETRREVVANGYLVRASPTSVMDLKDNITVTLCGAPGDFEVKFLSGERTRSSLLFGYVTTIFGGGNLVLRGLKSQEALRKLEKAFWVSVEEMITHMSNTA